MPKCVTNEELEAIEQRLNNSCHGPWSYQEGSFDKHQANTINGSVEPIIISHMHSKAIRNTLPFIAHSWEDVHNLIYTVKELLVQLEYEHVRNENNVLMAAEEWKKYKKDINQLTWDLAEAEMKYKEQQAMSDSLNSILRDMEWRCAEEEALNMNYEGTLDRFKDAIFEYVAGKISAGKLGELMGLSPEDRQRIRNIENNLIDPDLSMTL